MSFWAFPGVIIGAFRRLGCVVSVDHRLKQRLIGGAVLVGLGVIFLPMLLDGTGWREHHSDLLDLPPAPEFELPEPTQSVRRPVSIPEPPVETPAAAPPSSGLEPSAAQTVRSEPGPEPQASKRAPPPPEPTRQPRRGPAAAGKGWSVQVGAFEKKSGAEKLAARLRLRGYPVFIRRTEVGSKSLYRVKVGPVGNRAEALGLRDRLKRSERLSGLVQRER